jgi:GH43 family beta-xylosidase
MLHAREAGDPATYINPVYSKSFPDPFVLKFGDEYFAYSTGLAEGGGVFGVLRSRDLINWTEVGAAMQPLDPSPPYYWAPEVTYDNGKFYLYYSVGNETLMDIRVAVSDRAEGGFIDQGRRLTTEDFAIDAHVFIDDDNTKYLFYATDFLEHAYIGTGTVVDKMIDWFTLEGNPRPVTRAKYDWQVYDPNRKEKGGVRWHTVEGPAVLKRKGLYYEMFSGGNWQNTTYGVSFAISNSVDNSDEWLQFSDGENVLPILRTEPGIIVGPGHNCVVRGPNNRELYCVYHRWTDHGRVMAIDRMDFAGERIFVVGASHTPQPSPFRPNIAGVNSTSPEWRTTGDWSLEAGRWVTRGHERAELELGDLPTSFLCDLIFRCSDSPEENGCVCFKLQAGDNCLELTFHPNANVMRIDVPEDAQGAPSIGRLPKDFDWTADHVLRIDADHRRVRISLDNALQTFDTLMPLPVSSLTIIADYQSAGISAFQLTEGFEELFEIAEPLSENGWDISGGEHRIDRGELIVKSDDTLTITKHQALPSCEFTGNFRLATDIRTGQFGLVLQAETGEMVRFAIDLARSEIEVSGRSTLALPGEMDLERYHQLRIMKSRERALCYLDDALVAELAVADIPVRGVVFCDRSHVAVEMIRLTSI